MVTILMGATCSAQVFTITHNRTDAWGWAQKGKSETIIMHHDLGYNDYYGWLFRNNSVEVKGLSAQYSVQIDDTLTTGAMFLCLENYYIQLANHTDDVQADIEIPVEVGQYHIPIKAPIKFKDQAGSVTRQESFFFQYRTAIPGQCSLNVFLTAISASVSADLQAEVCTCV